MARRLVHWRLLVPTAVVTAIWTWAVVLGRGYATESPFAWKLSFSSSSPIRYYGLLLLNIAIWFVLFYWMVRGFTLMQRSPFRRPFKWRPLPPDQK